MSVLCITECIHEFSMLISLLAASFWGFSDMVNTLLEKGADVNHSNADTLWTPLHAATFQEHGKVYTTTHPQ